ncbi:ABC transporter ATP-binding protein [Thalassococcus sp. S3]|uniref:ABC transporter ATP-binding protein n=1 Tax=Thalassococcus sp. S3 TaxID=2017482 RepID=UPI0010246D00|nr:oligopeptide/dipeptide ABC transporter ATP-binding protein [Thalassococcus sp. S3]QBF32663.1 oligopeptide ABC transporter ATP-binding protein [Thalassococcus sp. S3]
MSAALLEARDLVKHFGSGGGLLSQPRTVRAVDGVSFRIQKGETFAIVGESGCGKSTLARLLMRLLAPTSGEVVFDRRAVGSASGTALRDLRRDMQFIFQDPFSSLNPRLTVGALVGEPLEVHAPDLSVAERRVRVAELLTKVGLLPEHAGRYPHEFSGGQRQRIGIARALASDPKLIIGDEPVSALDVSVQAQIVNLLSDLRRDLGLTLVIIAHDLAVIRHMSDRVAVMYLGRIVETGRVEDVFASPRHPYTQALLASIPARGGARADKLEGEMPSPLAPPSGCRFHTRCPHARPACAADDPALQSVGAEGHEAACPYWAEIAAPPAAPAPKADNPATAVRRALYRAALAGAQLTHDNNKTTTTAEE